MIKYFVESILIAFITYYFASITIAEAFFIGCVSFVVSFILDLPMQRENFLPDAQQAYTQMISDQNPNDLRITPECHSYIS